MTTTFNEYDNPLVGRYASPEMSELWSPHHRIRLWRRLWIMLAEAEQELGLAITDEQLQQMRDHADPINWDADARYEHSFRHDVMAHLHAFGDLCPDARPILHWGATSCFVTDNADLMIMRQALQLLLDRTIGVLDRLGAFARTHRDLACLAFTHLQPAQPTTMGKRACLWAYDLCLDVAQLEFRLANLKARSIKGTTGTQASFLAMFHGDHERVRQLERRVADKMGFDATYDVTGQTYPRKVDSQVLDTLSGLAQSAHKAASDLRILSSRKELDEPFEEQQIGSSAMAYKRNPMRSERICGLARFVMNLASNGAHTAATQWLERTLDDSSNRRLSLPQAFLAVDAILILYENIAGGLRVYPHVIKRHLDEELPFMATETILMAAVERGADRQSIHELIRQHSHDAARRVKEEGKENDLLQRLAAEPALRGLDLAELASPERFTGRASQQVLEFLASSVEPLQAKYPAASRLRGEVRI